MERITERYTDGMGVTRAYLSSPSHGSACNNCKDTDCETCSLYKAVNKLAALEEIMGTDYDIEKLSKLVEADRSTTQVTLEQMQQTLDNIYQLLERVNAQREGYI